MMRRVLFLPLLLLACTASVLDEDRSEDEPPVTPTDPAPTLMPVISPEDLALRRSQVIAQVNDLRTVQLDMGDLFGLVTISDPVPAQLPGLEAHEWTAADTEATSDLSWSPRSGGGGETYGQFLIAVGDDGASFTITVTMDLDGNGETSTAIATETKAAEMQSPEIW
jgi:hypothetical protein